MTGLAEGAELHRRVTGRAGLRPGRRVPAAGRGLDHDLAPTLQTAVEVDEVVPRSLPVLGLVGPDRRRPDRRCRRPRRRRWSTLAAGAWIGRTGRGDVADQFLVRHADRILPVAAFTPGPTVIDVSDAESLHRVAERFDTVVLHHAAEDEDVFVVRDAATATYRFVVGGHAEAVRSAGQAARPGAGGTGAAPPVRCRPPSMACRPGRPVVEPLDLTAPMPLVALPSGGRRAWRVA